MSLFPLKPTHKPVLAYYAALAHEVDWEEAVLKFSEKIPDLDMGAP
jgi:hypothetical protein